MDVWALANNHVLDYGRAGLLETLDVMDVAGLSTCGAGRTDTDAWRPAIGVGAWQPARPGRLGRRRLQRGTRRLAHAARPPGRGQSHRGRRRRGGRRLAQAVRPGDVAVVSIHWGSNWGYAVTREQRRFAHRLVDGGVDVVHGHSSHHPRPIEVYRERTGALRVRRPHQRLRGHPGLRGVPRRPAAAVCRGPRGWSGARARAPGRRRWSPSGPGACASSRRAPTTCSG